ncbi:MAG: MBL fold metallo-hydrolase, partial [Bacteroidetes bacterium]
MTTCTLQLLTCGYCTSDQRIALAGAPGKTIRFPALTALIRHPKYGNIVFDTGYASRVLTETKRWPGFLLGLATPIYFREEENLVRQLAQMGITPEQVPYLIISHFHADHTGGLLDFPESKIICHRDALGPALSKTGMAALRYGMLSRLFPPDIKERAWIMEPGCKEEVQVPVFER